MNKPLLMKKVQDFITRIEDNTITPLYELTPQEARDVLHNVQNIKVESPETDVEEIEVEVDKKHSLPVMIVRPKGYHDKLPVIFYIHGGGWIMGDFATHERLVSELAAGVPAAVIFPVYTPSPEAKFPQPTNELFAVLEYIVANGEKYNLDTKHLAVAGDSVGGNMATVMTIMAKEKGFKPKIDFQLLLYPVTAADFENASYKEFSEGPWLTKKAMVWFWDAYAPEDKQRQNIMATPLNAETIQLTGLPPALVITDENDVLRDEGEAYARKLNDAGVSVAAVRFNGTVHDFMMLNELADTAPTQAAITLAIAALQRALRQEQ